MVDTLRKASSRHRLAAVAALVLAASVHAAGDAAPGPAAPAASAAVSQRIEDFGVELVGVRLSGADFLIDLRYRVKDVAKAQMLLERKIQPVLVNEATGDRFYVPQVPKLGSLRQSATAKQPAQLDKVYFMLFANPDRKLRVGEKVTLHAGDSMVKGLVVR